MPRDAGETGNWALGERMSTQASLESIVGSARQHDLPGEELLRNETPPVSDTPANGVTEKAKEGDASNTGNSATPAPADGSPAKDASENELGENAPKWARDAVTSERKKRQALEQQLAELRGQNSVYQQQRTQPATAPSPPADPAEKFYTDPPKYVDQRLTEFEQRLQQARWQDRVTVSQELMREKHEDYDEMEQAFHEAAQQNPSLQAQLLHSPNPARFAYEAGKTYSQVQKYGGSFEKMREAMRAELKTEIEAEQRKSGALTAAAQASTSSAGARGTSATSSPVFSGPAPLSKILARRGR